METIKQWLLTLNTDAPYPFVKQWRQDVTDATTFDQLERLGTEVICDCEWLNLVGLEQLIKLKIKGP